MKADDPRHLWLAFGATDAQPIEQTGMRWRVGPIIITRHRLDAWRRLGWVEQTPTPSYLYLTHAGREAVRARWSDIR